MLTIIATLGLIWLSILIHELGHLTAYCLLSTRYEKVGLSFWGIIPISAYIDGGYLSPAKKYWSALAGPIAQLTASLLYLWLANESHCDALKYAAHVVLALSFLNLLPQGNTEGGESDGKEIVRLLSGQSLGRLTPFGWMLYLGLQTTHLGLTIYLFFTL